MKVKNRLSSPGIVVGDDSEAAFRNPLLPGDPRSGPVDMADQRIIDLLKVQSIHHMLPRDNKEMKRCNRRDVLDDDQLIILKHLLRRDLPPYDPAKNAILQNFLLLISGNGAHGT